LARAYLRHLASDVVKSLFPECCEPLMKYMGDHPSKQSRAGNELTDEIFEPALKHVCRPTTVYILD